MSESRSTSTVFLEDAPEERASGDPAKADPAFQCNNGAGLVGGAAADLDLAPSGLAAQRHQHTLGKNLDPGGAVAVVPIEMVVADEIEPDDLGTAEAAGEAEQQDGPVAQTPQVMAERVDHRFDVVAEHGLLLPRRRSIVTPRFGSPEAQAPI